MAGQHGFLYKLIPTRGDFAMTMTAEETSLMHEHVGYWSQLSEQGTVLAFGPVADESGAYGVGIVLATSVEAAEALRDQDPAVRANRGHDLQRRRFTWVAAERRICGSQGHDEVYQRLCRI